MEKPKIKILLMEDYPDLTEFYTGRLRSAGFEVVTEDDEDQGMKLALEEKPDLVILDISLPKAEDFWFIKEMKKHQEISAIPVIILTDLFEEGDIDRGMKAGASEYLIRQNFTFAEVVGKIKEVLKTQLKNKN
jgi:two-component system, OmpR family, alkaline phosphatase synthesis response regulator PhoP